MSKRCARCGAFNPRRSLRPPGDWVDHLVAEEGAAAPVGTLVIPLCADCYSAATDLTEAGADDPEVKEFLGDLEPGQFVDEVAG